MKRLRKITHGLVRALLPSLMLLTGCVTSELPPKLSAPEKKILDGAKQFPVVVAVEEFKAPVYSERLIKELRATGLFQTVCKAEDSSIKPDLVARVESAIYGTATVPIVTGITLGIVPTSVQESWGNDFTFVSASTPHTEVRIPYKYRTESILGWKALFMNFSPNWAISHRSTARYRKRFALFLLQNEALLQMIKKKTEPSTEGDGLKPAP